MGRFISPGFPNDLPSYSFLQVAYICDFCSFSNNFLTKKLNYRMKKSQKKAFRENLERGDTEANVELMTNFRVGAAPNDNALTTSPSPTATVPVSSPSSVSFPFRLSSVSFLLRSSSLLLLSPPHHLVTYTFQEGRYPYLRP